MLNIHNIIKKKTNLLPWSSYIINIVVIIFFVTLSFFIVLSIPKWTLSHKKISISSNNENIITNSGNVAPKQENYFWLPIRLKISKINIDAPIKQLWLTTDGAMETTKEPNYVAWYNLWPRPGEKGNAVIAGHYGTWKNGAISVFNKLDTLVKGDKIFIEDDTGVIISFIVREIKIYKANADAFDVFNSNDDKSHLNLITCVQDKITREYPNRLIVFSDKE